MGRSCIDDNIVGCDFLAVIGYNLYAVGVCAWFVHLVGVLICGTCVAVLVLRSDVAYSREADGSWLLALDVDGL